MNSTPKFFLFSVFTFSLFISLSVAIRNFVYTSVYTDAYDTCPSSVTFSKPKSCSLLHYAYFYATQAVGRKRTPLACSKPCEKLRWQCRRACIAAIKTTLKNDCRRLKSSVELVNICDSKCVDAKVRCSKNCSMSTTCPTVISYTLDWSTVQNGTCVQNCDYFAKKKEEKKKDHSKSTMRLSNTYWGHST